MIIKANEQLLESVDIKILRWQTATPKLAI